MSHAGTLILVSVLLIFTLLLADTGRSGGGASAAQCNAYTAHVLVGSGPRYGKSASVTAAKQFEKAGYTVVKTSPANDKDVVAAVKDPCIKALWIYGHGALFVGVGDDNGNGFKNEIAMGPRQLSPTVAIDTYISPATDPQANGTPIPITKGLNVVHLQSCGQFSQKWQDNFPGATFLGWDHGVTAIALRWSQVFETKYAAIDQDGNETASLPSDPGIALAAALQPLPTFDSANDVTLCGDCGAVGLCVDCGSVCDGPTLPEIERYQFGAQSFNFYGTDDQKLQKAILFGATTVDGSVTSVAEDGLSAPTFEVTMNSNALGAELRDPSLFAGLVQAGLVDITVIGTSVPPSELLADFGLLVFGNPPPVGGTTELLTVNDKGAASATSGSSNSAAGFVIGGYAAAVMALSSACWYARRRRRSKGPPIGC